MYDFHASRDVTEPGQAGGQSGSITPSPTFATAHDDPALSSAITHPAEIPETGKAAGAPTINEALAARAALLGTAILSPEVESDNCLREDRSYLEEATIGRDRQVTTEQV